MWMSLTILYTPYGARRWQIFDPSVAPKTHHPRAKAEAVSRTATLASSPVETFN